jgi:hypothetical protein
VFFAVTSTPTRPPAAMRAASSFSPDSSNVV